MNRKVTAWHTLGSDSKRAPPGYRNASRDSTVLPMSPLELTREVSLWLGCSQGKAESKSGGCSIFLQFRSSVGEDRMHKPKSDGSPLAHSAS
jgi:hypothetical protein